MSTKSEQQHVSQDESSQAVLPGIALDFGGPLRSSIQKNSSCSGSTGFEHSPPTFHDPFKMKPPPYPSLF